jgi:LysR family cys regulon transcriptional activator
VVVPAGHVLENVQPLTLQAIAEHPLITYQAGFTGRARIDQAFAAAGLEPDIVMSALDADVIKTYIELDLGVGIIASGAFDAVRDSGLRLLTSDHLFPPNVTRIAVRRGHYLRGFAYKFIEFCSPVLTQSVVQSGISPRSSDGLDA